MATRRRLRAGRGATPFLAGSGTAAYDAWAMIASILRTAALGVWLGSALGCAAHGGVVQQVAELERKLTELAAKNHALEERLTAVEETASQSAATAAEVARSAPDASDRPQLKVVRLLPEPADGGEGDAASEGALPSSGAPANDDSDAPRPMIRGDRRGVTIEDPPLPAASRAPRLRPR